MPNANPRGLVPTRHLSGVKDFKMTMRRVRGQNATHIMAGDIVRLVSAGVDIMVNAASGADTKMPLGVVGQVFNVVDNKPRPMTFSQPDSGPVVPVSTDAIVGVYEDPGIIYATNCSATASPVHIGKFQVQNIQEGTTAVGRSGHSITLGTTSTADGHFLKVYDISNLDGNLDEVPLSGAANQDVEVIFVNSPWINSYRTLETGTPASAQN